MKIPTSSHPPVVSHWDFASPQEGSGQQITGSREQKMLVHKSTTCGSGLLRLKRETGYIYCLRTYTTSHFWEVTCCVRWFRGTDDCDKKKQKRNQSIWWRWAECLVSCLTTSSWTLVKNRKKLMGLTGVHSGFYLRCFLSTVLPPREHGLTFNHPHINHMYHSPWPSFTSLVWL